MAMSPMMKVVHHIDQGAVMMYAVDASSAVARHPYEWSHKPWSESDARAARVAREERYRKEIEEASAAGLPAPPPLPPPPPEPTDEEKASIDADAQARLEAAEIVKRATEKEAKEKEEADKVAQAKALLASSPPRIDPNERRPFGRKGPMTPAEREAADKRAAKAKPAEDFPPG